MHSSGRRGVSEPELQELTAGIHGGCVDGKGERARARM